MKWIELELGMAEERLREIEGSVRMAVVEGKSLSAPTSDDVIRARARVSAFRVGVLGEEAVESRLVALDFGIAFLSGDFDFETFDYAKWLEFSEERKLLEGVLERLSK